MSRWLPGPGAAPLRIFTGVACSVAPTKSDLSGVKDEMSFFEQLCELNSSISVLPTLSSRKEVLHWIEEETFAILHFACHGTFDTTLPNDSSIKLSDGKLYPSDIQAYFAGQRLRPLVFINACHSGRVDFSFTKLGGWAAQLLRAKVGIFIGAMWEVNDSLALEFARTFYRKFLKENLTAAESFRQARQDVKQIEPNNSTWLAYTLYADPNSRIQDLSVQ